jgi:hypothetical protein
MNKAALNILLLLAFCCAPYAVEAAVGDTVSEVPFIFEKGHVIVPVKIKGNKSVEVILSTGAEHSGINTALLEKYKLQASYTGEGVITGTNDLTYSFATVPDIQIGDIKLASMNLRFGSSGPMMVSEKLGREIFGVFGIDFFKGRVVQFDFKKSVVRFLPEALPELLQNEKDGAAPGRAVLRMGSYTDNNGKDWTRPIVENVTFDGKKIKTLLDTGTLTVLSLSSSASKQLGLSLPPENGAPRVDKVSSLRLADMELNNVPVTLHAKGSDFDRNARGFGAIGGVALLQNFITTFDFRHGFVILEHR